MSVTAATSEHAPQEFSQAEQVGINARLLGYAAKELVRSVAALVFVPTVVGTEQPLKGLSSRNRSHPTESVPFAGSLALDQ